MLYSLFHKLQFISIVNSFFFQNRIFYKSTFRVASLSLHFIFPRELLDARKNQLQSLSSNEEQNLPFLGCSQHFVSHFRQSSREERIRKPSGMYPSFVTLQKRRDTVILIDSQTLIYLLSAGLHVLKFDIELFIWIIREKSCLFAMIVICQCLYVVIVTSIIRR